MAEEVQPGTANAAEPVTVLTAPEPTQAPQETTPPQQPPSGTGDSVEALRAELAERDRLISEYNERVARAEHEAMLTRNLVEQFTSGRGRPQEQAPAMPELSDDEFLTNPVKATSKLFEHYRELDRKEREREKVEGYVNSARSAVDQGKFEAVKANPGLYRGIETSIYNDMVALVQNSLKGGAPVDVNTLRNTKTWETLAVARRLESGEDLMTIASKYFTKAKHPMAPTHQETPSSGGVPQAVPTLSEADRAGARFFGLTDEQWLATKAKQAEGK